MAIMEEDENGMSVPNWLIDVLKWVSRIEMANSSLSFSCRMFKQICWPKLHGNVQPFFIKELEFCYEPENFGKICRKLNDRHHQIIPIASTPPPKYIHGFERIIIRFLDTEIIKFVKNIGLEKITLSFETSIRKLQEEENGEHLNLMRNLLSILAENIYKLQIWNYADACFLDFNFNRLFPTFIDQVPHHLYVEYNSNLDILFNWLLKPLTDGRQKILHYFWLVGQMEMEPDFINRIKKEFSHSTKRRNFLVKLEEHYDQFIMANEQTGEVLNLYHESSSDGYLNNFLARYPKGEEHWMEGSWEKIFGEEGKTYIQVKLDIDQ